MDRFLKRTEHPVSPVLPASKKPKVSSKQGVISASTLKIRTSLTRLFLWKELSNVPHEVIFKQLSTTKNDLIEKICRTFSAHFANIRRTRAALFTKFAAHLPHIKQFKESAAPHYLQNFAALYLCLCFQLFYSFLGQLFIAIQ